MTAAVGPIRLTYCGNVHAAADEASWLESLADHAVPVAAQSRAQGRAFGLGAFWPVQMAAAMAGDPLLQARVQSALRRMELPLWTLNVFPQQGFHDKVVKTAVYEPDWSCEERLQFTLDCAVAASKLAPKGATVPLSTLPLGYRANGEQADLRKMARNLARAASRLSALRDETGVHCVLALEPEPCCLLETAAAAGDFLEQWVFDEGAWPTLDAAMLRAHLGVCVDLCHLFVVGEDPVEAVRRLLLRGIAVPKVQVSSCLEVRDRSGLAMLLEFDEPRYLHQTFGPGGLRALDLGEVRHDIAAFAASLAAGPVRTHFHTPLYWDEDGPLGSTRALVERALPALRALFGAEQPVYEVETYTWSVLPERLRERPLPELLARELDFAAKLLGV